VITINQSSKKLKITPSTKKMKRTTPRHIKPEQLKISDRDKKNLKSNQKEKITHISAETLQARRDCPDSLKMLKGKNLQ